MKLRCKWESNIKMDVMEIEHEDAGWICKELAPRCQLISRSLNVWYLPVSKQPTDEDSRFFSVAANILFTVLSLFRNNPSFSFCNSFQSPAQFKINPLVLRGKLCVIAFSMTLHNSDTLKIDVQKIKAKNVFFENKLLINQHR